MNGYSVGNEVFNMILQGADYRAEKLLMSSFAVIQLFKCSSLLWHGGQLSLARKVSSDSRTYEPVWSQFCRGMHKTYFRGLVLRGDGPRLLENQSSFRAGQMQTENVGTWKKSLIAFENLDQIASHRQAWNRSIEALVPQAGFYYRKSFNTGCFSLD